MKKVFKELLWGGKIVAGCAMFTVGFNLFLAPNDLNAGGLSGLSMVVVHLIKLGTVGGLTLLINLVLFLIAGLKIGKRFTIGSAIGALTVSLGLDLLSGIPVPQIEPLLAALYGGVVGGLGLGMVLSTGASTGGSDIIVRLLKRKYQNVPIGVINTCFDLVVATLTGIAFGDITKSLYSGVTIFVTGRIVDAVVYSFDYSKTVIIISERHEEVSRLIMEQLDRGATYLNGEGSYSHQPRKVIFTVVKKQQIADLKRLVVEIDPDAFIVVQEAHQVLGEGFARYSKDAL